MATTIGSNRTAFNRKSRSGRSTHSADIADLLRILLAVSPSKGAQRVNPASGAVSSQASLPKVGTSTPMLLAMEMSTLVGLVLGSCR
jgi:hypothetical protein